MNKDSLRLLLRRLGAKSQSLIFLVPEFAAEDRLPKLMRGKDYLSIEVFSKIVIGHIGNYCTHEMHEAILP